MNTMRRNYLAGVSVAALGTTALAGCLGDDSGDNSVSPADTSHDCTLSERDPVDALPTPTVGSADAPVTVEVFEDFACSHCRDFFLGDLDALKDEYAGETVAFEHRDLPLPVSAWSERVANAARSVQDATDEATFFEFARLAYENQSDYSWQVVGDLASDVDVDPCRVLSDASNGTYDGVISADRSAAENRLDQLTTPSVFVNGEAISPGGDGWYGPISSAIESNL